MNTTAAPRMLTLNEVAALAGVTYRSVRRSCAQGRLNLVYSRIRADGKPHDLKVPSDDKLTVYLARHADRRKRGSKTS